MKKIIFIAILFLLLTGCTQGPVCGDSLCEPGEEENCPYDCEERFTVLIFNRGDYVQVTGVEEFEQEKLLIRVEELIDSFEETGIRAVKLSLLKNNNIILSRIFNEGDSIHEIFPIKDKMSVYMVEIDSRKELRVKLDFEKWIPKPN
jgi:hypothetical protein